MRFQLHIDSNNDALINEDASYELNRIIFDAANAAEHAALLGTTKASGALRDVNGNKVGRWQLELGTTS